MFGNNQSGELKKETAKDPKEQDTPAKPVTNKFANRSTFANRKSIAQTPKAGTTYNQNPTKMAPGGKKEPSKFTFANPFGAGSKPKTQPVAREADKKIAVGRPATGKVVG